MKIQTTLILSAVLAGTTYSTMFNPKDVTTYNPLAELKKKYGRFNSAADDDAFKSLFEIANENGYDYEEYQVKTQDGYILTLNRIPGLLNETKPYSKKPAVLLQHGLEADATQWVINSPEKSPAFILANEGYDVWMGNNRGCRYGLNHTSLNSSQAEFWNFDFEEMGVSDVPAFIDFILQTTGQSKLSYIGHSEGTTQMFIGLSMKTEYYKEKLNLFVALAPVANLSHTTSPILQAIAPDVGYFEFVLVDLLGMYDFFNVNWLEQEATYEFCSILPEVCAGFLQQFADLDLTVDNLDRIKTYLTHFPSGAGYRNLIHYAQIINSKQFQRYDYGSIENLVKYGQTTPPLYPVENIQAIPIALMGGDTDELGDPVDVAELNQKLGNTVVFSKQYHMGHMTFAIGKDMSFFSVDTINLLKQYATNTAASVETF